MGKRGYPRSLELDNNVQSRGKYGAWEKKYNYGKRENIYGVMQPARNSSKTDTFHEPITYEPRVLTSSDKKITFARHEYGRV